MPVFNIRRDVEDQYYRYKMPSIVTKIEGKGNGIKTVIVNMVDVAKALARPPAYPAKFFGGELGTQVKIDKKLSQYVINGAHDADTLQRLLDIFIDKFVLCQACKNPETEFEFTKDESILKDCKACGIHSPVDMRHKLTTYILKNKPEIDKNDKYRKNNERVAAATEEEPQDEGQIVDAQLEKDLAALPTAEDRGVLDDDWAVDTSAEAASARMAELSVKIPGEEAGLDPVDEFADYVMSDKTLSDSDIIAKAQKLEIREDKVIAVLANLLLDEKAVSENQIEKRADLFRHFIGSEKAQKGLLGGIERLVIVTQPTLLPLVSVLLKAVYDNDLVEEEVFLSWDEKTSKKYVEKKEAKLVREKAAPFCNWLREADEED